MLHPDVGQTLGLQKHVIVLIFAGLCPFVHLCPG